MQTIDDVLEHYGIKGMRWGVRRTDEQLARARGRKKTKEVSSDAAKAKESLKKAKKEGTGALSNQELQQLTQRLNLEQQYSRLTDTPGRLERGNQKAKQILSVVKTANEVATLANSPLVKQISDELKKK